MKILDDTLLQSHPWTKTGMVELLPVPFLCSIACPTPTPTTTDLNDKQQAVEAIWQNILDVGMRDPILVVVCKTTKTWRTEAGNHRCYQALKHGITHLPVATLVCPFPVLNFGNGDHVADAVPWLAFEDLLGQPYPYQIRLSEYLLPEVCLESIPARPNNTTPYPPVY